MLTTVTLTGADASVDPENLATLSQEFPFVEWGILIGSGVGNRFPPIDWIRDLIEVKLASSQRLNLSLHICGSHLRKIANGRSDLMDVIGPGLLSFDRCQLNWHGERQGNISENILSAFCNLTPWAPQIIFQLDGVNDHLTSSAARRFSVAGLHDVSHGAGVVPDKWAHAFSDFQCGWAGGLGPENVVAELEKIEAVAFRAMPYWIDMETKLRSNGDDYFCLEKCRRVLEVVRPFIPQ